MAADDDSGKQGGGGGGKATEGERRERSRPTISLPPRPAGFGFGFAGGASPGPMTLVSRLFSEDADAECQSFSQLLAGVIASSPAAARAPPGDSAFFTVPPGLSPAGLLDSPGFPPHSPGSFGISHQEALAQVTAQAACSNSQMYLQSASPESAATGVSMLEAACSAGDTAFQEMPVHPKDINTATSNLGDSCADQKSHSYSFNASKPADDGYNWRKYGQKQVKKSEFPRSYYRCTFPGCGVTKKVEHGMDGQVTEIIYKGQHTHEKPPPGRRTREASNFSTELNAIDMTEASSNFQSQKFSKPNVGVRQISKWDEESAQATTENLSGSSDGEDVANAELKTVEAGETEPHSKRSKGAENGGVKIVSSQKTVAEPRIIVQTTSEVDLLDDGFRWRKYGQKVVKGNPNPRSYYRCTFPGCQVRKHVERSSTDNRDVITTYEGKHDHNAPAARNSGPGSINIVQPKAMHAANHKQPVAAVLQLKEEYNNT